MNRLSLISSQMSNKSSKPLAGKTVVITGASRGIGLAIGLRCAKDGANVAILAKTTTPQPKLPGILTDIQELSILQQNKLCKQEERLSLCSAISATS
jgi:NAD(P)-dependent dehydrogenase (short-subunit alcohol dehydrogenase family)